MKVLAIPKTVTSLEFCHPPAKSTAVIAVLLLQLTQKLQLYDPKWMAACQVLGD